MGAVNPAEVANVERAMGEFPMADALASVNITRESLAKHLKRDLNAKETKLLKVKQDSKADEVMRQVIESTGGVAKKQNKYDEILSTTEEKVISVEVAALSIRQKAREDAQKLLGLYPNEKLDINANGSLTVEVVKFGGTQAHEDAPG